MIKMPKYDDNVAKNFDILEIILSTQQLFSNLLTVFNSKSCLTYISVKPCFFCVHLNHSA